MLTNHFRNFSSLDSVLLRSVIEEDSAMESDSEASFTDSGRIVDNFNKESEINSEPKSNILNMTVGKSYSVSLWL